ncbi:MAG: thioredoxin family protein [Bacillota bacterium]|jgi:small redox-active disulfide protein 2|nr:thioredoxin family protein [Bacillota bacterium]
MEIKILGTGCSKCEKLEKNVETALHEMNIEATVSKVEDLLELVSYGVMSTPGLVIDDEVKSVGRVLSVNEIKKLF